MKSVSATQRFLGPIVSLTVLLTLGLLKVEFVAAKPILILAQQTPLLLPEKPLPNTPKVIPTTSPVTIQQYNRLMQAGYASAQLRHYAEARQRFQEALNLRPNDIYARQAIFNIDTYQTINRQKFPPLFWLLAGILMMTLGICGIFFFLLHQSQQQFLKTVLDRREQLNPLQESLQNGIFPGLIKEGKPLPSPPPLQVSSVVPGAIADSEESAKLTAQLLTELSTADSRKRRRIIGELAQKGDTQAVKPLVDLMMSSDAQERGVILEALSQINVRSLMPMNKGLALALDGKEEAV
ncbi:MAG: hypothetical protein ACRC6M_10360 [Microcystaceae cyanobacterium]